MLFPKFLTSSGHGHISGFGRKPLCPQRATPIGVSLKSSSNSQKENPRELSVKGICSCNPKIVSSVPGFFLAVILLVKVVLIPGVAQSAEERELDDKIPKHLPIKVKIKKEKEKAFKDLKNDKWLRDFELEITNTGNKPIYFLSLNITLPEIQGPGGLNMGFPIHYGRSELGDIETKAEADDIPIKPGETYVYSFAEIRVLNWARFRQRENKPDPKKLILSFQILSFGDGTGFVGSNGLALPRPPNERSSLEHCEPAPHAESTRIVCLDG